jgi:hypothetical protein
MLLQNPNDLLFRIPALLHAPSSRLHYERTPVQTGRVFRGQVNGTYIIPTVVDKGYLEIGKHKLEFQRKGQ